jgi:hypothetical protein
MKPAGIKMVHFDLRVLSTTLTRMEREMMLGIIHSICIDSQATEMWTEGLRPDSCQCGATQL